MTGERVSFIALILLKSMNVDQQRELMKANFTLTRPSVIGYFLHERKALGPASLLLGSYAAVKNEGRRVLVWLFHKFLVALPQNEFPITGGPKEFGDS